MKNFFLHCAFLTVYTFVVFFLNMLFSNYQTLMNNILLSLVIFGFTTMFLHFYVNYIYGKSIVWLSIVINFLILIVFEIVFISKIWLVIILFYILFNLSLHLYGKYVQKFI